MMTPKSVYAVVILILVLFGVNIYIAIQNSFELSAAELVPFDYVDARQRAYLLPISEPNYIPILNSGIIRPTIAAKSALVFDTASQRVLFNKNSSARLPIASLTKVLSAVVVIENFSLEEIVTVYDSTLRVDGEKQDLYSGEKISIRNLLKLMLIESSNDSAYTLAEYAKKTKGIDFVEAMNSKAAGLGMKDSEFHDPAGLDDKGFSTGEDLVKLVEYSLKYKEIWDISSEKNAIVESSDESIKHTITSTNRLLGLIKDIIGGKTGYTDGAQECMIMVAGVPGYSGKLISIVLGSSDRFGDTQKLIEWTRAAHRWK